MLKTRTCIYLLILTLISVLLFSSCQPTPEKGIVINKGNASLEKTIIEATPQTHEYNAPTTWEESFSKKDDTLIINIDAGVVIPKTSEFPILNISPKDITQQEADNFIKIFFKDAQVYQMRPQDLVTQEDKLQQIEEMTSFYAKMQKENPEKFNEIVGNGELENEINKIKNEMSTLPAKYVPVATDTKFKGFSIGTSNKENFNSLPIIQTIDIEADFGTKLPATINIIKNNSNKMNMYNYFNAKEIDRFPSDVYIEDMSNPQGLKITYEEALKKAKEQIAVVGIEEMELNAACFRPTIATIYSNSTRPIAETNPYVYQFYFTREINGIPITYTNPNFMGSMPINMEEAFNEAWKDEVVSVIVNDDGVTYLNYTAPITINEVFSDNTTLLPFEEIKTHFVKQMEITDAYIKPGVIKQEFIIDEVRLGYAKVTKQNSENQYLLVPAWDFFGTNKVYYNDEISDPNHDEDNASVEDYFRRSYMTINAIDGSIINRSLGY